MAAHDDNTVANDSYTTDIPLWSPVNGSHNAHAIARVSIEGLFGQYNYELPSKEDSGKDLSRLFIMYGENGTGKTTLLKLIYHALSPEHDQGHRSFLARTRFSRFAIELFDGTVLEANRRLQSTGGSLLLTLHRHSRTLAGVELEIDETLKVASREKLKQLDRLQELLTAISNLNIRLYYLSDDRRHQGELRQREMVGEHGSPLIALKFAAQKYFHMALEPPDLFEGHVWHDEDESRSSPQNVMHRVASWVQHQVRRGATKGEGDVYSIYSKVISDIAHSPEIRSDSLKAEAQELVQTLRQLEETSRQYSEYGLTPLLPVEELIQSLEASTPTTLPVIYNVMRPHVDGIKARLTAMKDIYETIHRFTQTINAFYKNKKVSFHVDKGFTIRSGKEKLEPSLLSSGEKQLFLLLCNTILARKHASLFLIDEPELSLNVKWQRKLVDAVLDNTGGSNVQFLMATHSIELITQHRPSVVRLISSESREKRSGQRGEQMQHADGES
ncbi:MAG: AAA family ATPase [Isosphaeraceae bacterium]